MEYWAYIPWLSSTPYKTIALIALRVLGNVLRQHYDCTTMARNCNYECTAIARNRTTNALRLHESHDFIFKGEGGSHRRCHAIGTAPDILPFRNDTESLVTVALISHSCCCQYHPKHSSIRDRDGARKTLRVEFKAFFLPTLRA